MKQKKLIKSILHLISFGFAAKCLSIIAKIITTRAVGVEGMGYFSLISPIMLLLYTLGQLGLPTAITKLISSHYEKRFQIMISSLIIGVFINIFIIIVLYTLAPVIANDLLKNKNTLSSIYMLGLLTPLVFLSGIIKGYLFGVNKIKISSISQVTEELGRIVFLLIGFNYISSLDAANASMFAVIGLIVAEVVQILTQIIGNYKTFERNYDAFFIKLKDKTNYMIKDVLSLSIPISSNRFITTFTYFLEPIILTSLLTKQGFSADFIVYEYGLLESYAIPIIFLPGFFASALSTFLLPNLSSLIAKRHYKKGKNLFLLVTFISFLIGLFSAIICFFFPETLLNLLYKNIEATKYVRILSLPFIIYYIEAPISCAMYALSLEKKSLMICIISSIIRIISLYILVPRYNVLGTAYSTLIEIIIVVTLDLFFIFKVFRNNIRSTIV